MTEDKTTNSLDVYSKIFHLTPTKSYIKEVCLPRTFDTLKGLVHLFSSFFNHKSTSRLPLGALRLSEPVILGADLAPGVFRGLGPGVVSPRTRGRGPSVACLEVKDFFVLPLT